MFKGDKFIDAVANTQTSTGTRLKQSEIDFLLNTILKYKKYLASHSKSMKELKIKTTPFDKQNKQNVMKDAVNHVNGLKNDVIYPDDNLLAKYILKRAFVPPLASALSKNEMSSLHDKFKLYYLRNKVMEEVKKAKSRRSEKQEVAEEFVPSISVG